MRKPIIKVFSNHPIEREESSVVFSTSTEISRADGILAWQSPHPSLLDYKGPKGWYFIESRKHSRFRKRGLWRTSYRILNETEKFYYDHPNERYRVPHYTTAKDKFELFYQLHQKRSGIVAVVSNFGGRFWAFKRDIALRNRFICSRQVKLFGPAGWNDFSWKGFGWRNGPPANYCGEPPVRWHSTIAHYEWLSNFHAMVCFENRTEPYYFTEKFMSSVLSGCIPIYHAHSQLRDNVLAGAKWVDPMDFDFCPVRTLNFALAENATEYQAANEEWLTNANVLDTTNAGIFRRLGIIFAKKLSMT